MYYSEINQEVKGFMKVLPEWLLTSREGVRLIIQKSGRGRLRERSPAGAFNYRV